MSLLRNKINKLLIKFKNGDAEALKELFDFLFKKLVVLAGSMLQDKSQAEDVVSQTFLQICKSINTFNDDKDGYNWIFKILKNKALDINRKYKNEVSLDAELIQAEDIFDSVNNKADIYNSIRKLNYDEQQLILKRFFEDKSYQEIGEELGVTSQMAFKKINTILKKLKKTYENG